MAEPLFNSYADVEAFFNATANDSINSMVPPPINPVTGTYKTEVDVYAESVGATYDTETGQYSKATQTAVLTRAFQSVTGVTRKRKRKKKKSRKRSFKRVLGTPLKVSDAGVNLGATITQAGIQPQPQGGLNV